MQGYSDELIVKSGLASVDEKQGIHDKFWNRVMFPIMDVNSRCDRVWRTCHGGCKAKVFEFPGDADFR